MYGAKPAGLSRGADGRWPPSAFPSPTALEAYSERMRRAEVAFDDLAQDVRAQFLAVAEVCMLFRCYTSLLPSTGASPEAGAKLYSLHFASFIVMTPCLPSQVTLTAYLRSHPKASALRVKHRDATLYRTLRDAGMLEAALASSEA